MCFMKAHIAANLHCLWLIFHLASREDNFTMHSEKFLRLEMKQVPDVAPLTNQFPANNIG